MMHARIAAVGLLSFVAPAILGAADSAVAQTLPNRDAVQWHEIGTVGGFKYLIRCGS